MKFIVQGLHDSFDAEIPINGEDKESINNFIKEVEKRAPKGTKMILNAIKNGDNIYTLIENDIVTSEKDLSCSISCSDVFIRFQQKGEKNILDCRSNKSLVTPEGILEITYKQLINEIKYQYPIKNMTVNLYP